LVKHPLTSAVGFTGSLRAGRALMDAAASRARPIPVYAEMGSVNPIFIMPHAMETKWEGIANGLCASLTLGTGQFCTNPGLIVVSKKNCERLERFKEHLARSADRVPSGTMLTHGIRDQFREIVERVSSQNEVEVLTEKSFQNEDNTVAKVPAVILSTNAKTWIESKLLREEMFGPATLLVECEDESEMLQVAMELEGQLTASIFGSRDDVASSPISRTLRNRVGRLIFNDWPTGVEVCDAMVHGGPYPASSSDLHTSVGVTSIVRFARPVCFQDLPNEALPVELRDENEMGIWRHVNDDFQNCVIEEGSYAKRN